MTSRVPKIPPGGDTPRRLADAINRLAEGRSAAFGTVTLTPNATTTVVANPLIASTSHISLTPRTVNAAAEAPYISSQKDGSFTISHADNAETDRTFSYGWTG